MTNHPNLRCMIVMLARGFDRPSVMHDGLQFTRRIDWEDYVLYMFWRPCTRAAEQINV